MLKEKITALLPQNDKKTKKKIENLIFALIVLILTLFIVNNVFSKNETIKTNSKIDEEIKTKEEQRDLEQELTKILKRIKQVDDIEVLLTYSESEKYVPIYNESSSQSTTAEIDNQGGERTIESIDINKEVVSDANEKPITEKVIFPKIEGAIVVAKGNITSEVKNNIIQAISAATGLPVHKIQILEMR